MSDNPTGLIVVSVLLWVITVVVVGLRFCSKIYERKRPSASDWLGLSGWVFGTGLTILEIYGIKIKLLGYRVQTTVTGETFINEQSNEALHIQLAVLLLGEIALSLLKLSVGFLYWEIFAQVVIPVRRFLIVWMAWITAWTAAVVTMALSEYGTRLSTLSGTPMGYLESYKTVVPSGYAMVVSDVITSVTTLVIPIPVVLKLHMMPRQKLLTLIPLIIGAMSVGASFAKAYVFIHSSSTAYSDDRLPTLTSLSICNLAEVEIGIIAACGPRILPVLIRVFTHASLKLHSSSTINNPKEINKMFASEEQLVSKAKGHSVQGSAQARMGLDEEETIGECANIEL
ncbi:hypothetical protein F4804DRAFT_314853 [Jackrogersella minutella]|nr:hypothetical protein F4804DRAFT_314853 [Jackrogersella minutella]